MGAGNPLCEAEAKYIMYQLLEGLRYLHDLMISHRGTVPNFSVFLLSNPVSILLRKISRNIPCTLPLSL